MRRITPPYENPPPQRGIFKGDVNVSEPSPLNALLGGRGAIFGHFKDGSLRKNNPRITKTNATQTKQQEYHTIEGTISNAEVASLSSPPWLNFFFVLLTQHKKKKNTTHTNLSTVGYLRMRPPCRQ